MKWNKIIFSILNLPGIKVNRIAFLVEALHPFCTNDAIKKAVLQRPIDVISEDLLGHIARNCIDSHTRKVTMVSAVSGIPGGSAALVAIPVDLIQYYYHVLVIAQKLAYLYGYPDFLDSNGHVKPSAYDLFTIFLGVMMGSEEANVAISQVAHTFSAQSDSTIPNVDLSATIWFPVVRSVSKWVSEKATKNAITKRLNRAIPVVGGAIAGAITYNAFKPSAKRLQFYMAKDAALFKTEVIVPNGEWLLHPEMEA